MERKEKESTEEKCRRHGFSGWTNRYGSLGEGKSLACWKNVPRGGRTRRETGEE
jgi:hypothetical protein